MNQVITLNQISPHPTTLAQKKPQQSCDAISALTDLGLQYLTTDTHISKGTQKIREHSEQ